MSTYYKVVRRFNNNLYSSMAYGSYKIQYKLNEWTTPVENTGGIFVFKCLNDAIRFRGVNRNGRVIYECKVKNPRPLRYRAYICLSSITEFWRKYKCLRLKHKSTTNMSEYTYKTPEGTYLASAIKLTKEL